MLKLVQLTITFLEWIEMQTQVTNLNMIELQLVKGELQNSIDATKQEAVNIKETDEDMIKLLSHPVLPPKSYSEVLGKTTLQNFYHLPVPNKTTATPEEKPIRQTQQKKVQHKSTSVLNNVEPSSAIVQEQFAEVNSESNSENYTQVTSFRRPRQQKSQLGTNTLSENESGFVGREPYRRTAENHKRKIWLFISRVKAHVTEDVVSKYIQEKANAIDSDLSVKLLKTFYQKEDNNCFLVGVYQSTFWPRGVAFERFNFKKGHFLDNPRQRSDGVNNSSFNTDFSVFL
ncbi:hypothetical protein JTB14_020781 [Gonioctena quinquepunctata]|nr:hypothetical protein JTB14_020781 [Gonioctena quinquepunctata]